MNADSRSGRFESGSGTVGQPQVAEYASMLAGGSECYKPGDQQTSPCQGDVCHYTARRLLGQRTVQPTPEIALLVEKHLSPFILLE